MQNCAYIIFRDKTLESFGEFLLYIKKKTSRRTENVWWKCL